MKKLLSIILAILIVFSTLVFVGSAAGDSVSDATTIEFNEKYNGTITDSNKKDVYKFTLDESGTIRIKLTAYIYVTDYYMYDEKGNTVWKSDYQYWNNTTEEYNKDEKVCLTSGVYYFAISQRNGVGNYNFEISFESSNESFKEAIGGINNSVADASDISLGTTYYGQLATNDAKDIYKFVLPESGTIKIKLTAYIYVTDYYIYDEKGNTVWKSDYQYWNGTTEEYNKDENVCLTSGIYYFAVNQRSGTGNYNFELSFTSSKESFKESTGGVNNAVADASLISIGTTYYGQIANNDSKDIYKFTMNQSEEINLKITAYIYVTDYYIYDEKGNTVWKSDYQYWNGTTQILEKDELIALEAGTYYFAITQRSGTGNYNFSITKPGMEISTMGDANGDGLVTAVDARMILQVVAGLKSDAEVDMTKVDMNQDSQITAVDARMILQVVAGLLQL